MVNQKYSVEFNSVEFGKLSSEISKTIFEQIYFIHTDIRKISFPNGVLDVECFGLPTNAGEIKKNGLRLINETIKSFSKVEDEVTEENSCETIFFDDPMQHLISSGDVTFTAPGICVLQGDIMKIMSNCEKRVRKIGLLMGAEEQTYPVLLSNTSLAKNGYLKGFPHQALLVASLKRDLDYINQVAECPEQHLDGSQLNVDCSKPSYSLSPTVCYHCFEVLKNKSPILTPLLFTGITLCHRNEGLAADNQSLARLNSYLMREIISIGNSEYVEQTLTKLRNEIWILVCKLGLKARIVGATDPFFATESANKRVFQSYYKLKHELQLFVPHANSWLAVASFNNHMQSLVHAYELTSENARDNDLHSGCFGVGLERFCYALFSQFGFDYDLWPKELLWLLSDDANIGS